MAPCRVRRPSVVHNQGGKFSGGVHFSLVASPVYRPSPSNFTGCNVKVTPFSELWANRGHHLGGNTRYLAHHLLELPLTPTQFSGCANRSAGCNPIPGNATFRQNASACNLPLFLCRRVADIPISPEGRAFLARFRRDVLVTSVLGGTCLSRPLSRIGSWIGFRRARQACPSERFLGGTCLSRPSFDVRSSMTFRRGLKSRAESGAKAPHSIWSAAIHRRFSVKASAFTTLAFTVFCRNHHKLCTGRGNS